MHYRTIQITHMHHQNKTPTQVLSRNAWKVV